MRVPVDSYGGIRNEQGYLVLPKEFECKDGKFKQIRRVEDLAIYQRDFHFELIKIQSCNPFEITPGVFTEKKEGWPNDNSWGTLGWTYLDLQSAEEKLNELLNPETAPEVIEAQESPIKRGRGRPKKTK